MDILVWSNVYSVGVPVVDKQHQKLIKLINELYNAGKTSTDNTEVEKILGQLVEYTVYHFGTEEKYFQKYEYPDTLEHKKYHEAFVNKVTDSLEAFKKNEPGVREKIFVFLTDWLKSHILKEDKKFAPFFNEVLTEEELESD